VEHHRQLTTVVFSAQREISVPMNDEGMGIT